MNLLEYEAKELLAREGVGIPDGVYGEKESDLHERISCFDLPIVLKVQTPVGGRAKRGLVVQCQDRTQLGYAAARLFASDPSEDMHGLLAEKYIPHVREWYVAIRVDDCRGCPSVLASGEGGVDVERGGEDSSEGFAELVIDPLVGIVSEDARELLTAIDWPEAAMEAGVITLQSLYRVFQLSDAVVVEINPLVVDRDHRPIALDAKIVVDDAALFRHPEFGSISNRGYMEPLEVEARQVGLKFLALDGSIGIISLGAGITMALMDTIEYYGGKAANFLDSTGGIGSDVSQQMARLVAKLTVSTSVSAVIISACLSATSVKSVVEGVIAGLAEMPAHVPIFATIQASGASVQDAPLDSVLARLSERGVTVCASMDEAVKSAVAAERAKPG